MIINRVGLTPEQSANTFTDADLEGMITGNNPLANAWRELLAHRKAIDSKCNVCSVPLGTDHHQANFDCGGTCMKCMAEAGDPDCVRSLEEIRVPHNRFLPECLKPDGISGVARDERMKELINWFDRFYSGNANPKWLKAHAAELCHYILTAPLRPASLRPAPVITDDLGYFAFSPDEGAEFFFKKSDAIEYCEQAIDGYREEREDGWDDDVSRVCWGPVVQRARGYDAQGYATGHSHHTYQTCEYRLDPVEVK